MNRRALGLVAIALVAALIGGFAAVNFSHDDASIASPLADAPKDPVERGRYLALAGNCAGCHTARGGAPLAGGRGIETPFGTVYAGNLTPDEETGLGRWSADDFWRAMHHGRSRDGRLLYPAFPYQNFTRIAREDSDALFAWIKTLPAVHQPNPPHALRFPYDLQVVLAGWRALFFRPGTFRAEPQHDAGWNRGAYLVQGLGHCDACHAERNLLGATREAASLAGGRLPAQGWDAPALAPHARGPVPAWRTEDLVSLLATGLSRQGSAMGPMADVVAGSTQHLSQNDLEAIADYLARLGGSHDTPPRKGPVPPDAPDAREGRELYANHCADCHGARGEGSPGVYPALAGNQTLNLEAPDNAIRAVLAGGFTPATRAHPRPFGMPPYAPFLTDREVAAILGYTRQAWGNDAAPVSPRAVAALRGRALY